MQTNRDKRQIWDIETDRTGGIMTRLPRTWWSVHENRTLMKFNCVTYTDSSCSESSGLCIRIQQIEASFKLRRRITSTHTHTHNHRQWPVWKGCHFNDVMTPILSFCKKNMFLREFLCFKSTSTAAVERTENMDSVRREVCQQKTVQWVGSQCDKEQPTSPVQLCPRAEGEPWRFSPWSSHWTLCTPEEKETTFSQVKQHKSTGRQPEARSHISLHKQLNITTSIQKNHSYINHCSTLIAKHIIWQHTTPTNQTNQSVILTVHSCMGLPAPFWICITMAVLQVVQVYYYSCTAYDVVRCLNLLAFCRKKTALFHCPA